MSGERDFLLTLENHLVKQREDRLANLRRLNRATDEIVELRRQRDAAMIVCERLTRLPTAANLLAYRLIVEETPGFIAELRGIAKAAACIKGEQK